VSALTDAAARRQRSEPSFGLAVITRTGALVHWPNLNRRGNVTFCGQTWVDIHARNVAPSAVTCAKCRTALTDATSTPANAVLGPEEDDG
jgi:hypothetical protein